MSEPSPDPGAPAGPPPVPIRAELRREDMSTLGIGYLLGAGFILGSGVLAVVPAFLGVVEQLRRLGPPVFLSIWAGTVLLAIGVLLVVRRRHAAMPAPAIEIGPGERLSFPVGAFRPRSLVLSPEQVQRVAFLETARVAVLLIDTDRGTLAYPARRFVEPRDVVAVRDALRRLLASAPGGARRVFDSVAAEATAQDALTRTARRPVTSAIVALLVAIFLMETWRNAPDEPAYMLELGANAPLLVEAGEWYRVVTAGFLHWGGVHLIVNAFSLLSVGSLVETLAGPWRMLLIYLLSGIAGAAASAVVARGTISAGASAAVFGLLGGLAAMELLYRAQIPMGFRINPSGWIMTVIINAALPFIIPAIDWVGHLGGFAGGVLVGMVVSRTGFSSAAGRSGITKAAVVVVLALHAAALVLGIERAVRGPSEELVTRLAEMPARTPADYMVYNAVAWEVATNPRVSNEALEASRKVAEKALAMDVPRELRFAIEDTLAQACARVGRFEEALRLELGAYEAHPDQHFFATQVAKFLKQRGRQVPPDVSLVRGPEGGLEVTAPGPTRLYALVLREQELVGLLDVCAVPDTSGKARAPEVENLPRSRQLDLHEAHGTDTCTTTPAGKATPRFSAADPRALELP